MRNVIGLAAIASFLLSLSALLQAQASPDATPATPVFRAPVTVTVQTNHGEYKEQFEKVPYVAENNVYIFAGESFGVNVTITGSEISQVTYQPDISKADVTFKFNQNKAMMMMMIQNKTKRRLFLDALMAVPEKKGMFRTSVVPIEPGTSSFEAWPHAIIQLVLKNFRFSEKPAS